MSTWHHIYLRRSYNVGPSLSKHRVLLLLSLPGREKWPYPGFKSVLNLDLLKLEIRRKRFGEEGTGDSRLKLQGRHTRVQESVGTIIIVWRTEFLRSFQNHGVSVGRVRRSQGAFLLFVYLVIDFSFIPWLNSSRSVCEVFETRGVRG